MSQTDRPRSDLSPQAKRKLLGRLLRQQASKLRQSHPLSAVLHGLWFMAQLEPRTPSYNVAFVTRIISPVDAEALREAFQTLIDRHATLRTTYRSIDGEPEMEIRGSMEVAFEHIQVGSWDEEELRKQVQRRYAEPFDLANGPILRTQLLTRAPADHVLLVTVHHIACDDWSMGVLLREMVDLYQAEVTGARASLPPAPPPYTEHIQRSAQMLASEEGTRHWAYWQQQLAGLLPDLNLPLDHPRSPDSPFRSSTVCFPMDEATLRKLKAHSRDEETTLFAILLAAYQILLMRYSDQEDILVGVPMTGRGRAEEESVVGHFVNLVVLRGDLSGNPTFREFLARTRQLVMNALDHKDFPFPMLVQRLQSPRLSGRTPLFRVLLNLIKLQTPAAVTRQLEMMESGRSTDLGGLTLAPFPLDRQEEQFDLSLKLIDTGEGILCELQYDAGLFDAQTIERFKTAWEVLLADIADHPDTRITHLAIATPDDYSRILVEWNKTEAKQPAQGCVHSLFEAQVDRRPDAVAAILGTSGFTYGQLNARANQLAHYLRGLGVGPETLVGVAFERSLATPFALLGILKAGGAYLPLDVGYPPERLALLLRDSRTPIVLTVAALVDRLPKHGPTRIVCMDTEQQSIFAQPTGNPGLAGSPDSLAYVSYTSGTTGSPRGVAVTHRAIVRLLFGNSFVRMDESQRILHGSSLSFDASTFEIWGPLLHGGCCILLSGRVFSARELQEAVGQGVNTVWLTSSLFNAIVDEAPQSLAGVRQLVVGGEALSVSHVRRALEVLPETELINGYGPTEGTTFTCCYRIPRTLPASVRSVPIGRPIANTRVYVLDRHLQPVPVGVPGELHIGGDGLARGYLNDPRLTAEKFIPAPFSTSPGGRLYKTGDRVRYLSDGNLEFLGRGDNQVKIRGFRVEPEEVEAILSRHPNVRECAVVVREDTPDDKRLVAFVVSQQGEGGARSDIERFASQQLPAHMVPSTYVTVEALPRTPHGKIDRRSLQTAPLNQAAKPLGLDNPETPLQLLFIAVWEELLNIRPIGIRDDFFALGGHSLLAVKMVARIERLSGRKFPLSRLFGGATIERLSQVLLESEATPEEESLLTEVQSGSKRPIFFVHGDFLGGGFYCRNLARHLGPDQPFYALHPHGVTGGEFPSTLEAMAADHLELVRAVQPEGPYLLGGYCNGGIEAFEMAQQLQAQGQQVALLVLLVPAQLSQPSLFPRVPLQIDLSTLALHARRVAALQVCFAVCRNYVPRPYAGPLTVLLPASLSGSPWVMQGWKNVAQHVEAIEFPGAHDTVLSTHLQAVGEQLRKCIRKVEGVEHLS